MYRTPNLLGGFEPAIRGAFVADPPPDPLLHVEARLIGRQVFQVKTGMPLEKLTDRVSFMPPRPIDIKPDGVSPEAGREMPQGFQEPLTVPAWGS